MKGRSELHVNEQTMVEVVQGWINATMPGQPLTVTGITRRGGDSSGGPGGKDGGGSREVVFVIGLETPKPEAQP